MPLFMPQDPPDSIGEFKPLGPPLPRTPQPGEARPLYEKTGTDGVVRNTETGKLETNLPEPKRSAITEQIQRVAREFVENIEQAVLNEDISVGIKAIQDEDLWLRNQSNSFDIEVNSISAQSQQRVYSTPRQFGKSLIAEMYSRYGSQTKDSQLCQEKNKLNGSRPQLTQVDDPLEESWDRWAMLDVNNNPPKKAADSTVTGGARINWNDLPKDVKVRFLKSRHFRSNTGEFQTIHDGFYYCKDSMDQWTLQLNLS